MTDPCNANPAQQDLLIPNPLDTPCDPNFAFRLSTIQSERDEINTVIEFIKELRGVQRVNLIGWSGGGIRTGSYTSLNGENVEKLIILASSNYSRNGSSDPPPLPQEGYPMRLQSYDALIYDRWFANVHCEDQVEPGAEDAAWALIMPFDPLGSTWGTPAWNPIASPEGGIMRVPMRTNWGWNAVAAGKVEIPTLIMVGEFDGLLASNQELFEDLGTQNKVFIKLDCASHFAVWEKQHTVLQKASLDWLLHSSIKGVKLGKMRADKDGKIHKYTD
jgi:pimeloyl-ACP methyl ester carboxylesterase